MRRPEHDHKLRRSRRNSVLFGVCGGIAEHYDLSPWGVRLVFLLLAAAPVVTFPFMVMFYVVLAIMLPLEPEVSILDRTDAGEEVITSRAEALRRIHQRYESLEKRLERMESIVTSPGFEVDDELRRL
ncbi:MAG: PspC domain-containing protein [Candidatus Sumerlaeia bacterium]